GHDGGHDGRHGGETQPPPVSRSTPQPPAARAPTANDAGRAIAEVATQMVGVPYRYGGESPREGFDCSGLVFYAYARAGLDVPRNSRQLFRATRKIPLERAAEGDLVFFQDQEKLSHVGIYLGDGLFVHAPSSGRTVSVSSLDGAYYRRHLVGVGRLLPD
ncbi:MAG: C40 family peptidase, partial [Gammaproteobacteria bacterium]|nr:C40 family peptidase [Gammaproteobacteria bacterium]